MATKFSIKGILKNTYNIHNLGEIYTQCITFPQDYEDKGFKKVFQMAGAYMIFVLLNSPETTQLETYDLDLAIPEIAPVYTLQLREARKLLKGMKTEGQIYKENPEMNEFEEVVNNAIYDLLEQLSTGELNIDDDRIAFVMAHIISMALIQCN